MKNIGWRFLKYINRVVGRLRGSVGWCYACYSFNRTGMPEEEDDEGVWAAIPSKGRLSSWWGAFMFKWKPLSEEAE